ncbi:lipid A export ATP-binding/permease protein msbA [Cordyceps javanica]|uniref:Lipid A export ATP-binding/permease protein msbA n=1 Tax=Cordyceps javanica TaxID=43265 RepID=A0A545VKY1_9HYPO|nr:lipid A export ATP-binding/permease protein msbA [Cordyceps javanica]TQW02397.1 lipid A export ATP-binding/permease protein msbA [Cordyceps javanica]
MEQKERLPMTAASSTPVPSANVMQEPADDKKKDEGSFRFYLRVFGYNDTKGWIVNAVACLCMVASGTALPLMDVVFGSYVNVFNDFVAGTLSPAAYREKVAHYALYFIYLFIGKFLAVSLTSIRVVKRMRVDFVRQTLRQEIPFFDAPSSSVASQITTNGNLITNGIAEKLGITLQALSTFVAAFVVAFVVQWKLTLIVISIVPVNIIVTVVCVVFDMAYEYRMFDIYSASGTVAEEAFATIRTAHAFWAFPKLSRRFAGILEDARQVGNKKSLIYAILFPFEFFCIFAGYGLAFWQGMRMYASGEISQPGTVVTVIFAVLVAAQALTQIAPQTVAISKAAAAAHDMFAVIDRKSAVDSLSTAGTTIPDFQGNIKVSNVDFAYPSRPDVPVLQNFSIDIPANKTTAFVGASGSGKSTLFGLLERWYASSAGEITLDGHKLTDLNLQWLRTSMRLVQQEPTLFTGSIYQNVVDGLSGTAMADLPDEEKRRLVQEACESSYAHDFITELPNGYDTMIGERGASLSGGQKQRIVIARSIISNPKILLLDEATSALDPNAEKIVQTALNNVAKGRTMIAIAHRLSTIRTADQIIVMSKGQVLETGTHSELIKMNGKYAALVRAQDLGDGDGSADSDDNGDETKAEQVLEMTASRASAGAGSVQAGTETQRTYGLFMGLWIVIKEQPELWWSLFTISLCAIAGGGTYPALAVLFAQTMDAFTTINVSKANFYALMFFVVALGNLVAYAISGWLINRVGQHVMKYYRAELFDNTLRQDMAFFDKPENNTGALVSRVASEPTSLQELLSINCVLILITVVNILSSVILALCYGWKLSLVLALGGLPVLVASGYIRIRLEFKFESDTADRFSKSSGLASEAVMGIRTVSSLALEQAIISRYHDSLQHIAADAISGLGWKMFFYSLSQSISLLVMCLGFWYGGQLISTGEYTASQFYVIFIAIIFSGEAAALFFQYTTSITKAGTAINYILRLRRTRTLNDSDGECTASDAAETKTDQPVKGKEVICDDIQFAYPLRPNLKVLRGIDIDIQPGSMVAFVGASGCGKSTMIALLQRFYDPTSGQLRVDGLDAKDYDRSQYRRDIALVQQEPVLYQGSIRDNISLGLEYGEPSEEDIVSACQQANVWDFISSLPDGLGTTCGSQGLSLSGGQRQRIAIARALIRTPRLLLLDEATSALDSESEKVVKEALDRAAAGRTTIAVAHRLSTIRDADTIVVFGKGRVVERGTHEELIAQKGVYYEMVLGQSLDREA